MPTPDETERRLVRRNILRKTLLAAGIPAALIFFVFGAIGIANGGLWALAGLVLAAGIFGGVAFYAAIISYYFENKQSKSRLAEQQREARERKIREDSERKIREEDERQKAMLDVMAREQAMMDAQTKRDNREFILKILAHVNACIDSYDPASPDSISIKRTIAKDLTAIMVKHRREELAVIVAQEPEVSGMFIAVRARLREKSIDSAEAAEVLVVAT